MSDRSTEERTEAGNDGTIVIGQKALPMLLIAMFTGATGLGGYSVWQTNELKTDPAFRPDTWTAPDARRQAYEIRSEMLNYVAALHREIDSVETRTDGLESRCAVVSDRIERILLLLEKD